VRSSGARIVSRATARKCGLRDLDGTTPQHIAALAEIADGRTPRPIPAAPRVTVLAGLEPMVIAA